MAIIYRIGDAFTSLRFLPLTSVIIGASSGLLVDSWWPWDMLAHPLGEDSILTRANFAISIFGCEGLLRF